MGHAFALLVILVMAPSFGRAEGHGNTLDGEEKKGEAKDGAGLKGAALKEEAPPAAPSEKRKQLSEKLTSLIGGLDDMRNPSHVLSRVSDVVSDLRAEGVDPVEAVRAFLERPENKGISAASRRTLLEVVSGSHSALDSLDVLLREKEYYETPFARKRDAGLAREQLKKFETEIPGVAEKAMRKLMELHGGDPATALKNYIDAELAERKGLLDDQVDALRTAAAKIQREMGLGKPPPAGDARLLEPKIQPTAAEQFAQVKPDPKAAPGPVPAPAPAPEVKPPPAPIAMPELTPEERALTYKPPAPAPAPAPAQSYFTVATEHGTAEHTPWNASDPTKGYRVERDARGNVIDVSNYDGDPKVRMTLSPIPRQPSLYPSYAPTDAGQSVSSPGPGMVAQQPAPVFYHPPMAQPRARIAIRGPHGPGLFAGRPRVFR